MGNLMGSSVSPFVSPMVSPDGIMMVADGLAPKRCQAIGQPS